MSWLPRNTSLGSLEILETLVFFDGPRAFIAAARSGQKYIVAQADESETTSVWLYAPASDPRINMVRSGGLPFRDAFTRPEDLVFTVTLRATDGQSDTVDALAPQDIPDDWLPDPDFRFDLRAETLPAAVPLRDLPRFAEAENRIRLRLEISHESRLRAEAPVRQMGELLVLTQSVLDNLGLALSDNDPPQSGRIPSRVADEMEATLVGASAASFVLDIASTRLEDLLGESLFALSVDRLLQLLTTTQEPEALREELRTLRPRGAKSFRKFVEGLAQTDSEVSVAGAARRFGAREATFSASRLRDLSALLRVLVPDESVLEVRAAMRLYRADSERQVFGLRDEATAIAYEGKTDDAAVSQLAHATINDVYEAVIHATSVLDETVGETRTTYRLMQLSPRSDA